MSSPASTIASVGPSFLLLRSSGALAPPVAPLATVQTPSPRLHCLNALAANKRAALGISAVEKITFAISTTQILILVDTTLVGLNSS